MKKILPLILMLILFCSTAHSTITDQTQRSVQTATAGQAVFPYTWRVLDEDDMDVFIDGVITTSYSVSNVGNQSGGNITFNSGRASGEVITIIRNMPETQTTSYPAGGRLSTVNLEQSLDNAIMLIQDIKEELGRAISLPGTSTQSGIEFPEGTSAIDRAGKVPAWDSAGTGLELLASTAVDAVSVIAVQGDVVQGNSSGSAAKLAIGASGDILNVESGLLAYARPRNVSWKKGTDIAGAAALPVPDEDANYFDVTGTPTVTSISASNLAIGSVVRFHFDTIGTFTHDATNLALPGGNDITIAVGDEFSFVQYGTDTYRLIGTTNVSAATTVVPTNYRSGFFCSKANNTTIDISSGIIDVGGTRVVKVGTTTLDIDTASDWVSDVNQKALSKYGFISINADGVIELGVEPPDESDTVGNTADILRYNDTGTDTTDRRIIGWFFMDDLGGGVPNFLEVSNIKDGDAPNVVVDTDTSNDTLNDTSFGSDLTSHVVHFYTTGRGVVEQKSHVVFTSSDSAGRIIVLEIHDGADIPASESAAIPNGTGQFSLTAINTEKYSPGETMTVQGKAKISAGSAVVADKTLTITEK